MIAPLSFFLAVVSSPFRSKCQLVAKARCFGIAGRPAPLGTRSGPWRATGASRCPHRRARLTTDRSLHTAYQKVRNLKAEANNTTEIATMSVMAGTIPWAMMLVMGLPICWRVRQQLPRSVMVANDKPRLSEVDLPG